MDRDGDTDLLLNWHHLAALELFENRDGSFVQRNPRANDRSGLFENREGSFVQRNPRANDRSGLFENRGIPSLYAERDEIIARIERSPDAGLYLWHDLDRKAGWHFLWKDLDRRYPGLRAEIETNWDSTELVGLGAEEVEQQDGLRLGIAIADGAPARPFQLKLDAGTQLKVRTLADENGAVPPLFIGSELTPVRSGRADLWLPDPHGMAWVNVDGSAHPELFITRGGIRGTLRAPLDPKVDRFFLHRPDAMMRYQPSDPGTIPAGYGRGRRVEWVDVDLDGRLELSITNFATPNSLLVRDPRSGVFEDRAADFGLDIEPDVGIWGDIDDDGRPDFVHLRDGAIEVARNLGGSGFERISGEALGLTLPESESLQETATLRWADFDNDGALDLWVLSWSDARTNHLFRREGSGFRDISEEAGLTRVRANTVVVLADFDNDSFVDVVSFGRNRLLAAGDASGRRPSIVPALLWRNRGGESFEFVNLGIPHLYRAATALDADGDGRTDLVAFAEERHLLRNVSTARPSIEVELRDGDREPIGARVRAHYDDGTIAAQRYGSAHSTSHSQSLQPLRFGIPDGAKLESFDVRWPGETDGERFPVRDGDGSRQLLERRR
jgi:hypothetical protein